MTLTENQKISVLSSILVHAFILILLLIFTFKADIQMEMQDGLLVDFGYSDTGKGDEEPSAVYSKNEDFSKQPEQITQKATSLPSKFKPTEIKDEDLLTQDHEPSLALKTRKKEKPDVVKKKVEPVKVLEDPIEKKLKQERIAQQQLEERERQKKIQQEKIIGNINSRVKNAFGGGLTDNGSSSTSEGITSGSGNQGDPGGTPGVKRYGPGGGNGNGISYNLSGRQARSMPKPEYPGNESGIVVVEVTVDKLGKVASARAGIFGSNSNDPDLLNAATKAAKAAKFNVDDKAPAFQKGTITYHFVLQ